MIRTARRLALSVALLAGAAAPLSPPSAPPALAQAADIVLDGLSVALGPATVTAPRVVFRGTTLGRDEIAGLLDPASPLTLPDRLARLSAREILVPELVVARDGSVTTYRDLVLSDLSAGRLGALRAQGGTLRAPAPGGVAEGRFGPLAAEDVALDGLLALASAEPAGAPQAPPRRLYRSLSVEAFAFADPSGATARIGRLSARDGGARPLRGGLLGLGPLAEGGSGGDGLSPEGRRLVMDGLVDLARAVEIGTVELEDAAFAAGGGEPVRMRVARVRLSGSQAGGGAATLDGFEIEAAGGRVALGHLSLEGVSVIGALEGLRDIAGREPAEIGPGEWRRAVPAIGRMRIADLAVELPEPGSAPLRLAIGTAEYASEEARDGLPAVARVALRGIRFPIPPNPDSDLLRGLARIGFERLDLSLAASVGWNESARELVLREFRLAGQEVGSVTLRGVIGNLSPDIADPDTALAAVALLGANLKSLAIEIENGGLAERILARQAEESGRSVEDLRREYGLVAAIGVPALLGSSPAARTLGTAVARFVAKPGRLTVTATAKAPGGLGLAALAASPEPARILEGLDVTAVAE